MASILQPRSYVVSNPSDATEIFQNEQFKIKTNWLDDNGARIDLTALTIRVVATFHTSAVSVGSGGRGDESTLSFSQIEPHPTLKDRELTVSGTQQEYQDGVAMVEIPADLWTEDIAYGLTSMVPTVVLNLIREEKSGATVDSRRVIKSYLIVRPSTVAVASE